MPGVSGTSRVDAPAGKGNSMSMDYQSFLKSKEIRALPGGLSKTPELAGHLFDSEKSGVQTSLFDLLEI